MIFYNDENLSFNIASIKLATSMKFGITKVHFVVMHRLRVDFFLNEINISFARHKSIINDLLRIQKTSVSHILYEELLQFPR